MRNRKRNRNPLSDSVGSEEELELELFVPDDVMICILKRLDVRSVVGCRCVCKRWKDLTSTPQFVQDYSLVLNPISNNIHMILHWTRKKASVEMFCIDKWWLGTKPPLIHNVGGCIDNFVNTGHDDQPMPYCSQNGFILAKYHNLGPYRTWDRSTNRYIIKYNKVVPKEYIVRNPLTREQVKIVLRRKSDAPGVPDIFAIFLHPIRKEYCTLWRVKKKFECRTQYKMLNLGSSSWRSIGGDKGWVSGTVVCLDSFVYWMLDRVVYRDDKRIIAFDIKTEEFTSMSLPPPSNEEDRYTTNLLNADGFLSLVRVIYNNRTDKFFTIKIWTLKDPKTGFWTTSGQYVLSKIECPPQDIGKLMIPMAVAIVKSELVIYGKWDDKVGLFVCNLESGTIRNINKNNYSSDAKFWAHQPSIASLRNCQPVIHIHDDEE